VAVLAADVTALSRAHLSLSSLSRAHLTLSRLAYLMRLLIHRLSAAACTGCICDAAYVTLHLDCSITSSISCHVSSGMWVVACLDVVVLT
jgi:hypothetical protein